MKYLFVFIFMSGEVSLVIHVCFYLLCTSLSMDLAYYSSKEDDKIVNLND